MTKQITDEDEVLIEDPKAALLIRGRKLLTAEGFDAAALPDDVVLGYLAGLGDNQEASYVTVDEESGMFATSTGTPLGYKELAHLDVRATLEQLSERLAKMEAKKAGVIAARQSWLDRISDMYDARVNKIGRAIDWIKLVYTPMAKRLLEDENKKIQALIDADEAAGKKTKHKLLRHLDVGIMRIQFKAALSRVEVEDDAIAAAELRKLYDDEFARVEDEAIVAIREATTAEALLAAKETLRKLYAKELLVCEEWITKKETIAKSALPDEIKEAADLPGFFFVPGGDDVCTIK